VTSFAITQPVCAQCQAQLAPALLVCPGCGSLVHSAQLSALAEAARAATSRGDIAGALAAWREALELLPRDSKQYQVIQGKITQLGAKVDSGAQKSVSSRSSSHTRRNAAAAIGAALLFVLTKAKLLLLGLANWSTLASMLLSLGVYWTAWGWKFALGLVVSIYIHEMGHVVALRRFGFRATAPLFIPGLGAVIRLQQRVVNPHEDAVIGLAGPIYGLGAALVAAGLWVFVKQPIFGAIASVGAWVNLFNLIPVWTLDGGRAFHALSRGQRWLGAVAAGLSWYFVRDGMLLLLLIVIGWRAVSEPDNDKGDRGAAFQYVFLIVALSLLCLIKVKV
jgi:Zn-dependent protease